MGPLTYTHMLTNTPAGERGQAGAPNRPVVGTPQEAKLVPQRWPGQTALASQSHLVAFPIPAHHCSVYGLWGAENSHNSVHSSHAPDLPPMDPREQRIASAQCALATPPTYPPTLRARSAGPSCLRLSVLSLLLRDCSRCPSPCKSGLRQRPGSGQFPEAARHAQRSECSMFPFLAARRIVNVTLLGNKQTSKREVSHAHARVPAHPSAERQQN